MDRSRIVAVPEWVRPLGHVDGMIARGRTVYLAGQVGWTSAACSATAIWWARSGRH